MTELVFVLAPQQNHFFVELVAAIRDELDQMGVGSSVHVGAFPDEEEGRVFVLVPPHEWYALQGHRTPPTRAQLRRTIFICAEQPQTSFFVDNALLGPFAGAVFDISPLGVDEMARHHVDARPFALGWTRTWSTLDDAEVARDGLGAERDIDVLHLGIDTPRRARAMAQGGQALSRFETRLFLAQPDLPNDGTRKGFTRDGEKLDLLRRSRILANVHQGERPYFEWLRVVQAMSQGVAVVSEHSVGYEPLVPGRHLLSAQADNVLTVAAGLLADEAMLSEVAAAGYDFVRHERPLRLAVEELAATAEDIARAPRPAPSREVPALTSPGRDDIALDRDPFPGPATGDIEAYRSSTVRRALKDLRLELMDVRRELRRDREERAAGRMLPQLVVDHTTPAWRAGSPARVSIITALYNHEGHIVDALESVARGAFPDVEFVVVDDGSSDGSAQAVRDFAARRPDRPLALLRHPVNRGLGHARNSALSMARGEYAFILDADNLVHPHGIAHLVDALDADPGPQFAYGILETFTSSGPAGVVSHYPWEPRRLRNGNYIDAMAMWRRHCLDELGRYTTDHRLYGWEDYDLWCRCGERGVEGVSVPQIVARYRTTRHSMISTTDLSVTAAFSVLGERYPTLMGDVVPPP